MICTLFTGHPVRRVFLVRYTYEYKLKCVEKYRQGEWPETPEGVNQKLFRDTIRRWIRVEESGGPEALKSNNTNRVWNPDEKYELVAKVIAGGSLTDIALKEGINSGMLYQWVQKYKTMGYNGLVNMKRGRPPKEPTMKKRIEPVPLTESEREELIRLRAENEYIKAENEIIKKEIALREERQAALLKAKKQQSSRNSVKKDIN